MSVSENVVGQEFQIGETISKTFSVYLKNFVPLTLIVLVLSVPSLLLSWYFGHFDQAALQAELMTNGFGVSYFLPVFVSMLTMYLVAASVTYGVFQSLNGGTVVLGECLSKGLSRIVPVILVGILATIVIGIGMVLLIVPGIMAAVALIVVLPVAVIENPGAIASLKRSAELTSGSRWMIFGLILILGIAVGAIGWVIGFVSAGLFISGLSIVAILIGAVFNVVAGTFFQVLYAVVYNNLRVAKEGISTSQIAAVFD
ncbi:hypothetical protein [Kiloniella laminariae]|uniref:hypothetical protein n=1 Tax=Kiloniella laminariae TaxID=454162 RepID=UPI000380D1EC|nr:hypothetical protein [Kiloniella laminariae]